MKTPALMLILSLLCSSDAYAQSKLRLKELGNVGLPARAKDEYFTWHRYLPASNQLILFSDRTLQLIDLTTRKVIVRRQVRLPPLTLRRGYDVNEWQISPDGRRLLITGEPGALVGKKQTAWIWDLEQGTRIAVLEQMPGDVRYGWWSGSGKTLITFDSQGDSYFKEKIHVTFWDGETFECRTTIAIINVTWIRLANDGERFLAASGTESRLLGAKQVTDLEGVISIWSTRTGKLEKTIAVASDSFSPETRNVSMSADNRYLAIVNKHKRTPEESRLLIWEVGDTTRQLYELKPRPRIDDSRVVFSPDGRYFALDVGKNLQIYETATGIKKAELVNVELPDRWLNESVLLRLESKRKNLFEPGKMLAAFDAGNGRMLYSHPVEYEIDQAYGVGGSKQTIVTDETTVLRHPSEDIFVTQSNDFVRLYDSRTGQLLQDVVSPNVVYDPNTRRLKKGPPILEAFWTNDGQTLCLIGLDRRTVLLWELVSSSLR